VISTEETLPEIYWMFMTGSAMADILRTIERTMNPIKNDRGEEMSIRSNALARRLERGALALEALAHSLTESEWQTRTADGRKIGVVVHHVATMYPIEVQLAEALAEGKPVEDVTWNMVHQMNADHAQKNNAVTKKEALELLSRNSKAAAQAIRSFSDEQLDRAAAVSLNADAPLTCQFIIEDHAVRHSYHHFERIRAALRQEREAIKSVA
jgi:hypothetical protein